MDTIPVIIPSKQGFSTDSDNLKAAIEASNKQSMPIYPDRPYIVKGEFDGGDATFFGVNPKWSRILQSDPTSNTLVTSGKMKLTGIGIGMAPGVIPVAGAAILTKSGQGNEYNSVEIDGTFEGSMATGFTALWHRRVSVANTVSHAFGCQGPLAGSGHAHDFEVHYEDISAIGCGESVLLCDGAVSSVFVRKAGGRNCGGGMVFRNTLGGLPPALIDISDYTSDHDDEKDHLSALSLQAGVDVTARNLKIMSTYGAPGIYTVVPMRIFNSDSNHNGMAGIEVSGPLARVVWVGGSIMGVIVSNNAPKTTFIGVLGGDLPR